MSIYHEITYLVISHYCCRWWISCLSQICHYCYNLSIDLHFRNQNYFHL